MRSRTKPRSITPQQERQEAEERPEGATMHHAGAEAAEEAAVGGLDLDLADMLGAGLKVRLYAAPWRPEAPAAPWWTSLLLLASPRRGGAAPALAN